MKHVSILFLVLFVGCASAHKKDGDKPGKEAAAKVVHEKSNVVKDKKAKPAATTATHAKAGAGAVTCKGGGDERVLEVVAEGSGCKTIYTKGGQANSIATSANGTQHCQEVSDRVLAKLQAAGFNCQ